MDTREYTVLVSILLKPVGVPKCRIRLGNNLVELIVDTEQRIDLEYTGKDYGELSISHYGKNDRDPDTALIIEQVKFDTIYSPKFAWEGVYIPDYPPHVTGPSKLSPQTYLGWNGQWVLHFTLPIYTWIHKVEGLGWIYD